MQERETTRRAATGRGVVTAEGRGTGMSGNESAAAAAGAAGFAGFGPWQQMKQQADAADGRRRGASRVRGAGVVAGVAAGQDVAEDGHFGVCQVAEEIAGRAAMGEGGARRRGLEEGVHALSSGQVESEPALRAGGIFTRLQGVAFDVQAEYWTGK